MTVASLLQLSISLLLLINGRYLHVCALLDSKEYLYPGSPTSSS